MAGGPLVREHVKREKALAGHEPKHKRFKKIRSAVPRAHGITGASNNTGASKSGAVGKGLSRKTQNGEQAREGKKTARILLSILAFQPSV